MCAARGTGHGDGSRASTSSPRDCPPSPASHRKRIGARGGDSGKGAVKRASSGLLSDAEEAAAEVIEEDQCSLRGLVWKVLLGTIHTDAMLYIRLVAKGPSSEDFKIREDTFRTFPRDEVFRRRVNEDKLSRINNAYVRLNQPHDASAQPSGEKRGSCSAEVDWDGDGDWDAKSPDDKRPASEDGSSSNQQAGSGKGSTDGPRGVSAGDGGKVETKQKTEGEAAKGLYVQGMMVLCAPLLFVMPEVDAFYCFNNLLNRHMPRQGRDSFECEVLISDREILSDALSICVNKRISCCWFQFMLEIFAYRNEWASTGRGRSP